MKKRRIVEQRRIGPCRRTKNIIRWWFKLECGHHGTRDRPVADVNHVGRLTSCKSCTDDARRLAVLALASSTATAGTEGACGPEDVEEEE